MRVVQVKLLPTDVQAASLDATLRACNSAATQVAIVAQERDIHSVYDLRALTYQQVRAQGIASQAAQHVIKKVIDAVKTKRANLKAGNYGKQGSPRCLRVQASPVRFRPLGAQPFDARNLSWDHQQRTISIWTVHGRVKDITYTARPEALDLLAQSRIKESDLAFVRGHWYLHAIIDLPEPEPATPVDVTGVDLGIVRIAVTSEGQDWSGGAITLRHKKGRRYRQILQAKGTRSAKRKLKKRSGKDSRFVTDTNHRIAKTIVSQAQRTGHAIAIENLGGIRARVRHRKPARADFHSWAFAQLGQFLTYKAQTAGVELVVIDPRNTSRECSTCGHIDKKNRPDQATFACRACGHTCNADHNAARVIRARGLHTLGLSQQSPNAA